MASCSPQIHPVGIPFSRRFLRLCFILVILIAGAALRFYGLDWARGYYFQPDESVHTIDYLLRLPPSLNPYAVGSYTYGDCLCICTSSPRACSPGFSVTRSG